MLAIVNLLCFVVLASVWFLAPVPLTQGANLRLDARAPDTISVRATIDDAPYGTYEWFTNDEGLRSVPVPIRFSKRFTSPPQVIASLSGIDWVKTGSTTWNVQVKRGSVTESGFELLLEWKDTSPFHWADVAWQATGSSTR